MGRREPEALPREPLPAIQYISRYVRYLGNLRALGREAKENVAVIMRGADQILPADGTGFRARQPHEPGARVGLGRAVHELPFASILIADNLNDVEPLVAFSAHASRIRVPLPDAPELQRALALLAEAGTEAFPRMRTWRSSPARWPASRSRARKPREGARSLGPGAAQRT